MPLPLAPPAPFSSAVYSLFLVASGDPRPEFGGQGSMGKGDGLGGSGIHSRCSGDAPAQWLWQPCQPAPRGAV